MSSAGWKFSHCLFCGVKPRTRTKEHFVPRWMSKASGADHIAAAIDTPTGTRAIKFSQLTLPACEECNSDFSDFEGRAKEAFEEARSGQITGENCVVLLDWMDKLRVSYFLYMLIARDHRNVTPRFVVNNRIAMHDRLISLSLLPNQDTLRIRLVGGQTFAYVMQPSVFGLLYRDLCILSWSSSGCMTDYFGVTKPIKSLELHNGHPVVKKVATGGYRPADPSRVNRLPSFTALMFSSDHVQAYEPLSVFADRPCRVTGTEMAGLKKWSMAPIPRSQSSQHLSKMLFCLSVFELQKRSLEEFDYLPVYGRDADNLRSSRRELDDYIDESLAEANATSLFKYRRNSLRTV